MRKLIATAAVVGVITLASPGAASAASSSGSIVRHVDGVCYQDPVPTVPLICYEDMVTVTTWVQTPTGKVVVTSNLHGTEYTDDPEAFGSGPYRAEFRTHTVAVFEMGENPAHVLKLSSHYTTVYTGAAPHTCEFEVRFHYVDGVYQYDNTEIHCAPSP